MECLRCRVLRKASRDIKKKPNRIRKIQEKTDFCELEMLNNSGNSIGSLAVRYNKTSNDAKKAEELDKICLSACLHRINSTSLSSSGYWYNFQDNPYFASAGDVKFIVVSCFSLRAL